MSLGEFVSEAWHRIQGELFPFLAGEVGPLGKTHRRFVAVPGLAPVERHLHHDRRGVGRPPADRNALARAFVAKAVWDLPTTRALIDRLGYDPTLRGLCGRSPRVGGAERIHVLPRLRVVRGDPAARAGARGACQGRVRGIGRRPHLPGFHGDRRTGEARGEAGAGAETEAEARTPEEGRGAGQGADAAGTAAPGRLERQLRGGMSTEGMVGELPKARDVGAKRNAKGYKESWRGYRLHIDAADGDVPVSRVLTSASLHDSQAAIPLARMTAERVDHRYELMDAVCDSREIGLHARMAGRVAIIDANPRRDAAMGARLAGEALARRRAGHVRHDRARHRRRPAWRG